MDFAYLIADSKHNHSAQNDSCNNDVATFWGKVGALSPFLMTISIINYQVAFSIKAICIIPIETFYRPTAWRDGTTTQVQKKSHQARNVATTVRCQGR
ncbi:hypothetical protein [Dyella tabacisoli]|uniref:hypothetical protein n=1 Tax=Dyella tabacisoli TaxID=2282381 RepID=UPI0013B3D159|nr:hypothetical protein [Dyella tabacisoli]